MQIFKDIKTISLDKLKRVQLSIEDVEKQDEFGSKLVHIAALNNKDPEVVKYLVESFYPVDLKDKDGRTSLHLACIASNLSLVKVLLNLGADVNSRTSNGKQPLHFGIKYGSLDIVDYLLDNGADINSSTIDYCKWTNRPIEVAFNSEKFDIAGRLIERGSNLNLLDENGTSILSYAMGTANLNLIKKVEEQVKNQPRSKKDEALKSIVFNEHPEVVSYYLDRGFDLYTEDSMGSIPLERALRTNPKEEISILLYKRCSKLTNRDIDKKYLLNQAVEKNFISLVELLVADGADIENTGYNGLKPIHEATNNGSIKMVNYLIDIGVNLESTDLDGITPIHQSVFYGNLKLFKLLKSKGAKLDNRGIYSNESLLHTAISRNHIDILKELIKTGMDLNITTSDGLAPVHNISGNDYDRLINKPRDFNKSKEVINLLLENNVDINTKDNRDWTALNYAIEHSNLKIFMYLLQCGATLNIDSTALRDSIKRCSNIEILNYLKKKGFNYTGDIKQENDLLESACIDNNYNLVNFLIELGVDINRKINDLEQYPIHLSIRSDQIRLPELLLTKGADINSRDFEGKTPLHLTAERFPETVRYLVKNGADINALDNEGKTPLHYAYTSYRSEVAKELINLGADQTIKDIKGKIPEYYDYKPIPNGPIKVFDELEEAMSELFEKNWD